MCPLPLQLTTLQKFLGRGGGDQAGTGGSVVNGQQR